jgi:Fe-S-cluster-containing dehydrogenase component
MDDEKKESGGIDGFMRKTSSRKDFLKMGGKGIAGTVFAASLLSFLGSAPAASGEETKRVWATASGAIIHDPSRCSACKRCETNCTMANDGKAHPYISRVKISRNLNFGNKGPLAAYWTGEGQFGNFKISGETCRQCKDPYCGNACPVGAIVVDEETGARVVDVEKCIGCGTCQRACPWGMATLDPEYKKSTKCVLCYGDPQCVRGCPNGALKFVPWEEAIRKYQAHWETHV